MCDIADESKFTRLIVHLCLLVLRLEVLLHAQARHVNRLWCQQWLCVQAPRLRRKYLQYSEILVVLLAKVFQAIWAVCEKGSVRTWLVYMQGYRDPPPMAPESTECIQK